MIEPEIRTFVVGDISTNCYSVECPVTGAVLVVDPGAPDRQIERELHRVDFIVYTHGHFDHVGGAAPLIRRFNPESMIHPQDVAILNEASSLAAQWGFHVLQPPPPSGMLQDGFLLHVGHLSFRVLHTPGHSMGSVCLEGHGVVFTGDTLFAGSVGRTDLPNSSPEKMKATLKNVVARLDSDLVVYPGHGPSSTMAYEKKNNPFLRFS